MAYLVLGALATMASASPQAIPSASTESALPPQSTATAVDDAARAARADLTVKFCTDAGFRGSCDTYAVTKRVCYNLAGNRNDKFSSFGPSSGTCTLWR
ncbi:MAG: hypothetical protein L6R40_002139 [Gallowayella cf. fulva]|nr:MAG: hypothetical protein L6R40_002139 [Xanthomendoza cf. fulva]